jgi:hypothetical protein
MEWDGVRCNREASPLMRRRLLLSAGQKLAFDDPGVEELANFGTLL